MQSGLSTCYYSISSNAAILFCVNSFRNLIGVFHDQWKYLVRHATSTSYAAGPIRHGNADNKFRHNASRKNQVTDSIIEFLQALSDERGEPYATRFIRESTSVGLRNEEEGVIELPSSVSKRQEYSRWCYERGWIVPRGTAKGSYGKVSDYAPREVDELWPEGSSQPVASWSIFIEVWKLHFAKLKVRRPCEDTCGECFILRNDFRYLDRKNRPRNQIAASALGNADDDDSTNSSIGEELDWELNDNEEFPEEQLINRANEHVVQAQAQRALASQRIQEAKEASDKSHAERRFVFFKILLPFIISNYITNHVVYCYV